MRISWFRLALAGLAFTCPGSAIAASAIYSFSSACGGGLSVVCSNDYRFGDPATSSVSRLESYVPPEGGGYSYSAEARASGVMGAFSLFAHAGGNTYSPRNDLGTGQFGMVASAQIQYHDEVTLAGSGPGFVAVPWHVTGFFDFPATSGDPTPPGASFGVSFCQSIPAGANSGGKACIGGSDQVVHIPYSYDMVLTLEYTVERGAAYALNTTFSLSAGSGAGLASAAVADFSHTGLMGPISAYDGNHNLILSPQITSASGLNYLNPQAIVTPVPPALLLLCSGVLALGWLGRTRA